jgi:aminoglycoside 6'-N-acetyltransferase I
MPDLRGLEEVRNKLIEDAIGAYEDASVQGLCAEGAWEAAVSAMRAAALQPVPMAPGFAPHSYGEFQVRAAQARDVQSWGRLRHALWPSEPAAELAAEAEAFFSGALAEPSAVLLAERSDGTLVGFAELSLRSYAEDCSTSPVGFLEGWYVVPEARRRGVGRALVAAAEKWAAEQGCTEFASDTRPENRGSIAAHLALGFEDAGTLRCFRKNID